MSFLYGAWRAMSGRMAVCAVLILCLTQFAAAAEVDPDALVESGLKEYRAGQYEAAAASFSLAAEAAPDDLRIAFNRACALAAAGKLEEARALWREAALAPDLELAARCHYNLGGLAAAEAQTQLGEDPLAAKPEAREASLTLAQQAIDHYRDCLALDPQHADARHNLELLRRWQHTAPAEWAARERVAQREKLELVALLQQLIAEQVELRATSVTQTPLPRSPRRWQALYEAAQAQRQLQADVEPLQQKLAAALAEQPPAGSQVPPSRAAALVEQLATDAGTAMTQAADQLAGQSPAAARTAQNKALAALRKLLLAVASFQELLQAGITTEEALVKLSQDLTGNESNPPAAAKTSAQGAASPAHSEPTPAPLDYAEQAAQQAFVTGIGQVLPLKAKALLEQLDAAAAQPPQAGQTPNAEQLAGLKKSLQAAIALSPQVQQHSRQAEEYLLAENSAAALPEQQEVLRLLKEIAATTPPPPQDQPQDQQQQKDQQSQQQQQSSSSSQDKPADEEKSEQKPAADEESKPQDPSNSEDENKKNSPESQDDGPPEEAQKQPGDEQPGEEPEEPAADSPQPKPAPGEPQNPQEGQSPGDLSPSGTAQRGKPGELSPEQTAVLLQKVRERQRDHRQRLKEIEQHLQRSRHVERDW